MKRWIEEEPVAVTEESIEHFLTMLESLTSKAALVSDNLIRDFAIGAGARNAIAAQTVRALYFALKDGYNERVRVFFEQWALQFAEVHGTIENKKFDSNTLFESYGFKKQEQKDFDFLAFFFALDTYYAILMKLLAYQVVGFYTLKNIVGLPLEAWEELDTDTLRNKVEELEEGGIFHSLGIRNFLEGDLLSWYLNDWNKEIEFAIRTIIERLNQYDPQTMELLPDETRDIFKRLYQFLVPKQIRHDLGEYYTPDWLAERCLNQLGYGEKVPDLLKLRLLDPGCGSGTFPILAIKRAREHARLNKVSPAETLSLITRNIVGFDLNPLAVISARTNYLLAIADLLPYKKGEITIPIYLCDSINPPRAKEQSELFDTGVGIHTVSTSVGKFRMPNALIQRDLIQKATNLLEDSVKKHLSEEKFLERARAELKIDDFVILTETYAKLLDLEKKGINGIWARIIKNAFAPLFMGEFDFVVGNPPWVNWEALPHEYREATAEIWQRYNLFEQKGLRARLGSAKDDISVLMTYVAIDKYLKEKGKLCFVITQTLFKTIGGGEGFRRFRLGKNGVPIKVLQVDDMTELQPFDSAINRTAVFFCQKGEPTEYPVEYALWKKKEKGSIGIDLTWSEVQEKTKVKMLKAQSIDGSAQGPWISARPRALKALRNVFGKAPYQARAGTCTWLNGVYWGSAVPAGEGFVKFTNMARDDNRGVATVEKEIESNIVFPLLRGREVNRWHINRQYSIIIPQETNQPSKAIPLNSFKKKYPKGYDYFSIFEQNLADRSGYKKYLQPVGEPYYAIYNVGLYTFAPFKVVWKEQSTSFQCSVVSSEKGRVVVPDHKLMLVPFENEQEAYYVCALLNSTPSQLIVQSYTISTQQSTHILENIKVPKFEKASVSHGDLARISRLCHEKTTAGIDVSDLEEQIDELAAELWGLTKVELVEIKESLEEMK